jgi:hypothetical protein
MNTEIFDTITYLMKRGIPYRTPGKDVSQNWIGVNCPFCKDDPETHLGINMSDPRFQRNFISCWRCGKKGNIYDLIKDVERCNHDRATRIIEEFQDRSLIHLITEKKIVRKDPGSKILLPEFSKEMMQCHYDFLVKRRYDPDYVTRKYDLYFCNQLGKYKYRIVMPIYQEGKLVTFIARDTTGLAEESYLALAQEQSIKFSKECVYGIDDLRSDTGAIVEGVFDQWRIGDGALATFGVEFTTAQLVVIAKKISKAVVLYDAGSDAQLRADKLAWQLAPLLKQVIRYSIPKGDPDELNDDEVAYLKKDIFGR